MNEKVEEKINNRRSGSLREDQACSYLVSQGYRILERNYHAGRFGEIDIIASDPEGMLVIIECKYRSDHSCGDPLEAVDIKKQKKICRTTLSYYMKMGYDEYHPCRFDVIAVSPDKVITHIKNAFDFVL